MTDEKFEEMSLIGHLTELRKRLLWSFLYILIIFIFCFYYADELFSFLAKPLVELLDTDNGQGFIYTALQEAFFTELKIAFFFALFNRSVSFPKILKIASPLFTLSPTLFINSKPAK